MRDGDGVKELFRRGLGYPFIPGVLRGWDDRLDRFSVFHYSTNAEEPDDSRPLAV